MKQTDYSGIPLPIIAFLTWGCFPLFWKHFNELAAFDVLVFRILCTALTMTLLCLSRPNWRKEVASINLPQILTSFITGGLMMVNWFIYVWGIHEGKILECSLGYYLTPIATVSLGSLFLGEHLGKWRVFAVGSCIIGVAAMSLGVEGFPWISFGLAFSFSTYSILKKKFRGLGAIPSFTSETLCMLPWAFLGMIWVDWSSFQSIPMPSSTLAALCLTGVVTSFPLVIYNEGIKKVPLGIIGMLQFIAPTVKFTLGLTLFGEELSWNKILGFTLIWSGVCLFLMPTLMSFSAQKLESKTQAS